MHWLEHAQPTEDVIAIVDPDCMFLKPFDMQVCFVVASVCVTIMTMLMMMLVVTRSLFLLYPHDAHSVIVHLRAQFDLGRRTLLKKANRWR